MRPGRFILALILIVTGSVMVLVNMGYSSWAFFRRLIEFWPVLLIILGISLLWGGDIPRWLGILVVIAVVAGIILLAINYPIPFYGPGPFA